MSLFLSCRRSSDELPVIPPVTHPLTKEYIGFGVVNVSFSHLLSEIGPHGVSEAYLRRGTVVRIIERVQVINSGKVESWVMAESNFQENALSQGSIYRGWLQESILEIYDSESQANTASKALNQ